MAWKVLYTIKKFLECRCLKWARMTHLHISNTSYGQKKGRESNWQFDSQTLKVGNRPDSLTWRWCATYPWKALNNGYKFASNLISIGGFERKVIEPQSRWDLNIGNFEKWESRDKMSFGCESRGEA
jgi:hypothetical protein